MHFVAACCLFVAVGLAERYHPTYLKIPARPPVHAREPMEHFLSYSIEFSSFSDFAGNLSHPNVYSDNLLGNIAFYAGSKPLIRVGGNTQDLTYFNKTQAPAVLQNFDPHNPDYPANQSIGPAFFESYLTWPGVQFIHGFNMAGDSKHFRDGLLDSIGCACTALRSRLAAWEFGNESDIYGSNKQGQPPRTEWTEASYVAEWLEWTRKIRRIMQSTCPDMASKAKYKYMAPSFANSQYVEGLDPVRVWKAGLGSDETISYISLHNYIGARGLPGMTLQGTLMNRTSNQLFATRLQAISKSISKLPANVKPNAPLVLGEGNSLARQGVGGISNSFGAALWGLDFALQLVVRGVGRWHMHQGTNYRYQAWQPIHTRNTTLGTKAPYYGNIAVSAFLGNLTSSSHKPRVTELPLAGSDESLYISYTQRQLRKVLIINMREYQEESDGNSTLALQPRPSKTFTLQLPRKKHDVKLQWLMAGGSDAITGITFDGYSYAAELANGLPIRLSNVTQGRQMITGKRGELVVEVPDSSAVIIDFT